jgi:hypothetical protein
MRDGKKAGKSGEKTAKKQQKRLLLGYYLKKYRMFVRKITCFSTRLSLRDRKK